tara:strand:- start:281 stop:1168 length:888 start_codon:yes stop_codon:yes gene_type:complete
MKWILIVAIILISLPIAIAEPIDFNVVKYDIRDNFVSFRNEINFHLDEDIPIEIELPINYYDLSVNSGGNEVDYTIEDNRVKWIVPKSTNQLIIEYKTEDFLEVGRKNFFITEFENQLFSSFVFFELSLPEGSVLDKSVNQGKSVYPEPEEIISDGQRIIINWRMEDVLEGQRTAVFVTYKDSLGSNLIVYFIVPLIAIILFLGILLARKPKEKVRETIVNKPELHLKEEEKQIVRIIEKKEGKIEQGTLVIVSDFSKAKVSQILKELEERKIVKKVKKGKKNIIMLKSKLLDLE